MKNKMLVLSLFWLLPLSANASDMSVLNGKLSIIYMLIFMPLALLVHFIATIYFNKRDYYLDQAFTRKHLLIAMSVPALGVVIIIYEYLSDLSSTGIHIGTLISVLFIYGLAALLFAIPYLIHLTTGEK